MKPVLHAFDPETAHKLTIAAGKIGLTPNYSKILYPRLVSQVWDKEFLNPIGLAAGFDKNAEIVNPILKMGFGFAEAGTVTPKPQLGNPEPRIFRDNTNNAVINRMGFPNKGAEEFEKNIGKFLRQKNKIEAPVGINIGMNKDQEEPEKDYRYLIRCLGQYADYFTINISSPNTPGLRNLQQREHLLPLIKGAQEERRAVCNEDNMPPLLIKLAPDLEEKEQEEIAKTLLEADIDGIIVTNTTLERPEFLPREFSREAGGLSGAPLTEKSTRVVSNFYKFTKGKIPIIGAGGISNAQDAYDKIKAGASLVQLYSALVFHGPELISQLCRDLDTLLEKDGFNSISDAVGSAH